MKKNLIIVLLMAITMPLYFFSDLGYASQTAKSQFVIPQEENSNIEGESALNASNIGVYTALHQGNDAE